MPFVPIMVGISQKCVTEFDLPPEVRGIVQKSGRGGMCVSVAERLFRGGDTITDLVKATVLHEMVHIRLMTDPLLSNDGHGDIFAAECNRIGKSLGLPTVYACADSDCDRPEERCNHWPDGAPILASLTSPPTRRCATDDQEN